MTLTLNRYRFLITIQLLAQPANAFFFSRSDDDENDTRTDDQKSDDAVETYLIWLAVSLGVAAICITFVMYGFCKRNMGRIGYGQEGQYGGGEGERHWQQHAASRKPRGRPRGGYGPYAQGGHHRQSMAYHDPTTLHNQQTQYQDPQTGEVHGDHARLSQGNILIQGSGKRMSRGPPVLDAFGLPLPAGVSPGLLDYEGKFESTNEQGMVPFQGGPGAVTLAKTNDELPNKKVGAVTLAKTNEELPKGVNSSSSGSHSGSKNNFKKSNNSKLNRKTPAPSSLGSLKKNSTRDSDMSIDDDIEIELDTDRVKDERNVGYDAAADQDNADNDEGSSDSDGNDDNKEGASKTKTAKSSGSGSKKSGEKAHHVKAKAKGHKK